jgi:predicted GIY-YIG superfamily endonuclease
MEERCFVYMLQCSDGSYYVGQTDDLDRRVAEHEAGGRCDYTSARRPVRLVWSQQMSTPEEATVRELQLKAWSRRKKEALISGDMNGLRTAARKNRSPGRLQ